MAKEIPTSICLLVQTGVWVYSEDEKAYYNSQKGINIAITNAAFGSALHLRPADKYKMHKLKREGTNASLGYCTVHVFLKKLENVKIVFLKTCRHHLLKEMNTSLVKKAFILHLAPHNFTVVHYINIWTNVNSYNHNIVK